MERQNLTTFIARSHDSSKQGILSKNAQRLLGVTPPSPSLTRAELCGYEECFRILRLGLRAKKPKGPMPITLL